MEITINDVASFSSARYCVIVFHAIWIFPFGAVVINAPFDIDEPESSISQIVVQDSSRVHFVRGRYIAFNEGTRELRVVKFTPILRRNLGIYREDMVHNRIGRISVG